MEFNPTQPPVRVCEDLFDVEMLSMAKEGYANRRDAAIRRRRALVLLAESLQKDRDVFIPYLALCYFDRFSSRAAFLVEYLEVAVFYCLFLALKTRDTSLTVEKFLTTRPNLNINKELIPEMEAQILKVAEGRMCPVNALSFVGYFTEMIPDDMRPSPRIVKEIIIQAAGDIDSTQYRPSVIAASGVSIASSVRFPERLDQCFERFASCNRVNKGDLSRCTEMIQEICKKKHIFGVTSQAAEASSSSSSSSMFHRPGKELVAESSHTMEEIETRPGKEQAVEIELSMHRPGKELVAMEEIERRPGKEQAVEMEDIMYFELKWDSDEFPLDESDSKEGVAIAAPVINEMDVDMDEAEDDSDDERAEVDEQGYEADDEGEVSDSDSSNNSTITDDSSSNCTN